MLIVLTVNHTEEHTMTLQCVLKCFVQTPIVFIVDVGHTFDDLFS